MGEQQEILLGGVGLFYGLIGIWGEMLLTIEAFSKLKIKICKY